MTENPKQPLDPDVRRYRQAHEHMRLMELYKVTMHELAERQHTDPDNHLPPALWRYAGEILARLTQVQSDVDSTLASEDQLEEWEGQCLSLLVTMIIAAERAVHYGLNVRQLTACRCSNDITPEDIEWLTKHSRAEG